MIVKDYLFIPEWPILYMDNHLLALYKPAGLPVQGDASGDISLLDIGKLWLKEKFNKPGNVFLGLVHRLDRPVAGVMLFCRTSKAAGRISEQIRSREIKKTYIAVLEGNLKQEHGILLNNIERIHGKSSRILKKPTKDSSEARLSFRKIMKTESLSDETLVEIDLETGRHHQIRAQFGYLGHPVKGDLRYGAKNPMPERQIALLAKKIEIIHPVSHEKLVIESPVPEKWPVKSGFLENGEIFWNWLEIQDKMPHNKQSTQNPSRVLRF